MVPKVRCAFAALLATATTLAFNPALAQPYPAQQPIRIIVPFTPGSPNDVVARLLAQSMTPRLGQSVVVENRPGAGTNAGTRAAASSDPNGYTILFNSSSLVVSPAMYRNPGYDPIKSFVPIANAVFGTWLTVVNKSIRANTVPEFIAYVKKNPGQVAFGYGQGTAPQLVGEWLKVREGLDMTSVPYKGGAQAVIDLIGGRIQFHIGAASTLTPHVKDGSVKALAIWSEKRDPGLPDVPTMIESGYPGLSLGYWAGLWAPAGTPEPIVRRLNEVINDSLRSAEVKDSLTKLGLEPVVQTPEEFGRFVVNEVPRWAEIVKISGVKGD